MSQCPVCEAQVIADFGLVECESCGAQLLVQVDGSLEYQGADKKQVVGAHGPEKIESPPPIDFVEPPLEVSGTGSAAKLELDNLENDKTELSAPDFGASAEGLFDFSKGRSAQAGTQILPTAVAFAKDVAAMAGGRTRSGEDHSDPENDGSGDDEFDKALFGEDFGDADANADDSAHADDQNDNFGAETADDESALPEATPPPVAANADYDFDDPGGGEPPPPAYNSAPGNSPDLSDVARFGNSDLAGSRDGALRYTLFIEGIDTSDVRAAFREAITDRKFVWDIDSILRQVRNGEVTIQNVAPSKAYILITRLRNLPIKVRWEQYAISQT